MSVEILMLRGLLLDYAESQDDCERMLGELLRDQTHYIDGELFVVILREIFDGLRRSMDQFEKDWQVIK